MRILITGSNGYLGSVLGDHLIANGLGCDGIDTGFFNDCILYEQTSQVNFKKQDVRFIDKSDLIGYDAVVHLSGISNDPMGKMSSASVYDPTRLYTHKIASFCKDLNIKFIFASSCSVYGIGEDGLLNEDSNVAPQTGYSLNKYQIEEDLRDLADEDFTPVALRFATVFGLSPRMRFDIVANMFAGMALTKKQIILNSDGSAWRPLLHIDDLCNAVLKVILSEKRHKGLLVLNVGDEKNNYQVIDIAKTAANAVPNCEIRFLSQDPDLDKSGVIKDRKVDGKDNRTYKVSFKKIQDYLDGFRCTKTLKMGIIEMVDKFNEIRLSTSEFQSEKYYRLQRLESKINSQVLTSDLYWS